VTTLSCPACGAPVSFRSAAPYAVCSHCQSLIVRRDVGVESIGRVAAVPADFSPLQLGTSGTFDRRRFTLVGRIRKSWADGSWNEWCAQFDDQQFGWLAEAQGDLVMTFERPKEVLEASPSAGSLLALDAGSVLAIGGKPFSVTDIEQVNCASAEGELQSSCLGAAPMTCIDLHGPGIEFATIEVTGNETRVFIGRFVESADCRFSGLRTLDGWAPASGAPTQ
jgi:hypothetical protein